MEYDYQKAKIADEDKDRVLGFNIESVERSISGTNLDKNYWLGLPPQVLQTPYLEFEWIMSLIPLEPNMLVVDIGAGYGRLGYVIGTKYPGVRFLGIEVVKERVTEGVRVLKKLDFQGVSLIHGDVGSEKFILPFADVFFIYDFGCPADIRVVLDKLGEISSCKSFIVVGRGRLVRDIIERENPWLSQIVPPRHFANFSIYRNSDDRTS